MYQVLATWTPRLTDNTGIVPPVGEHKSDLCLGKQVQLINGLPRSNVVRCRTHTKCR